MSTDHDRYRDGWGGWAPFYAEGYLGGTGSASVLSGVTDLPKRQPIGFRGAAPGASLDERGKPRIRVKALSIRM